MNIRGQEFVSVETGIWKRIDSGQFFVRVGALVDGKRKYREQIVKNLQAAKQIKRKLQEDLFLLERDTREIKIGDLLAEFLINLSSEISSATYYRQEGTYRHLVIGPIAHYRFTELTLPILEEHVRNQTNGKSAQTQRHFVTFIRKFLKYAFRRGHLKSNLGDLLVLPKRKRKALPILKRSEASTLLAYLKQNHRIVYYHVAIAIFTGMRAGEIRGLKWSDIDSNQNVILVRRTVSRKYGEKPFTKNGEFRQVPINSALRATLEELKPETFTNQDSLILPYFKEFWMDEQSRVLRNFCAVLGITSIRFHDLRAL